MIFLSKTFRLCCTAGWEAMLAEKEREVAVLTDALGDLTSEGEAADRLRHEVGAILSECNEALVLMQKNTVFYTPTCNATSQHEGQQGLGRHAMACTQFISQQEGQQ